MPSVGRLLTLAYGLFQLDWQGGAAQARSGQLRPDETIWKLKAIHDRLDKDAIVEKNVT